MWNGTAASEGIGIGNVLVIEEVSLQYTPHEVTDVLLETERFREAVRTFIDRTEAEAAVLKETAGEKEAEILLGHISMIRDPYLDGEIEKLIQGGMCAEAALENMCDMFINVFSAADDEVTRQRAADVRDVKAGVLGVLVGASEVRIQDAPKDTVLVAKELTPSMTAGINKEHIVGIVTETGGRTSHSAILARALEIPAVLSVENVSNLLKTGETVIVDGTEGLVIASPDEEEKKRYSARRALFIEEKKAHERFRGRKTESASGEKYELFCNIGKPEDAVQAIERDGEGVGLFRTEFLFMGRTSLPSEEEQYEAYKKAAMIMKGKPVIIRTLDIGGDKDIPYMGLEKEENPFMGFRAIRYCLNNKELFKTQLRAILRASASGDVRIMFPLVTAVEEVRSGRALVEECKAELRSEGIAFQEKIPVGIMVETAAASLLADVLAAESDFFSIGTNDLTGYTMAADRGNSKVSYLYSVLQPSVLRSIQRIICEAGKQRIPVGMCGEAAADPRLIPLLISFGLTEFSVSASSVLKVRKEIARWTKEEADRVASNAMRLATREEVEAYLNTVLS